MRKIITILILLFAASICTYSQSYRIIVNAANNTNSLSKKEASDFFLKKKLKWQSGISAEAIDLAPKSPIRENFSTDVLGKNTGQVRAFWQQAIFSGSNTPPREANSDDEVIEFVKNNPGAIGYVSLGTNVSGVKTINVTN